MTPDTPWLNEDEQHLWRRWLRVNTLLPSRLHRELQADSELSLADFEVLVRLTDDAERRVRVSDLARALNWERSRLSHHVSRMERRGLVRREECRDDGRGAFVALTPKGGAAIDHAAPSHVQTVRRLVFDLLSSEDVDRLDGILDKLLAGLEEQDRSAR